MIDPEDAATLIIGCFGFTIPVGATIISAQITKFIVIQGSAGQTWTIYQTHDHSTPILPSTTKTIAAGSSVLDLATFDVPGALATRTEINDSGYGIIITAPRPAFGTTGPGLDYMEITITYDDGVVEPVVLSGTASDSVCDLSWTSSPSATGYRLERALAEGGPYATVYTGAELSFHDSGRTNGVTYWYRCYGTKGATDSVVSNLVSLTPAAPLLPPTVTKWEQAGTLPLTPIPGYMLAEWTAVVGATLYELQYSFDLAEWNQGYLGAALTTQVHIASLIEGVHRFTPWYAKVRAKVGDVWTDFSEVLLGELVFLWDGYRNTLITAMERRGELDG